MGGVKEGEDAGITNPKQAMKIGAHNCRAAINGTPFIKLSGVIEETDFVLTKPCAMSNIKLVGASIVPSGEERIEPWAGGPFDAAFDSPLKPWELLEMTQDEAIEARCLLEKMGFEEATASK